jgi:hypothetical protein
MFNKTIKVDDTRILVQANKENGQLLIQFDSQSQGEFGVYLTEENQIRDVIRALLDGAAFLSK